MEKHPELPGIGIDESTAIVVRGDKFNVIGEGQIYVHEAGKPFYTISHGGIFDLNARVQVAAPSR